ncbi:MAG TPA: hypothetical protein VL426_02475 [Candidatus Binatia bacterium]|jgi:hypothetical protein|nr:hypothetical protein [Candidatus Binatia bacterium]
MWEGDDEERTFVATVDPAVPLWKLIEAGRYRVVDADINAERFGAAGPAARTIFFEALPLGALVDGEAALTAVAAAGFRPATFRETLAVCARHPLEPADGILAALGTVWADGRFAPPRRYAVAVHAFGGKRHLDLHPLCFPWKEGCKVLVTRAEA